MTLLYWALVLVSSIAVIEGRSPQEYGPRSMLSSQWNYTHTFGKDHFVNGALAIKRHILKKLKVKVPKDDIEYFHTYKYKTNGHRREDTFHARPNDDTRHTGLVEDTIPGIMGPEPGYDTHASSSAFENRRHRRDAPLSKTPDKSLSMPLADHSPGTSMAENPMAFIDWSQAPIQDDQPASQRTVTQNRRSRLTNGRSMAEAILLGTKDLWQWDYVIKEPFVPREDDQYYGLNCCTMLPYICGVDGLCILAKLTDCELFCQCASDHSIAHCPKTIPRIKKVMRKLENKLIFDVAIQKRIVVPPKLERRLEMLKSLDVTTTSPPFILPPTPPVPPVTPARPQAFDQILSATASSLSLSPTSSSSATVRPIISTNSLTKSRESSISTTPTSFSTSPKGPPSASDSYSLSTVSMTTQRSNAKTVSESIPDVDEEMEYDNDYEIFQRDRADTRVTTGLYTPPPGTADQHVTKSINSTLDNCWNCEETGGACVMGNDFRAHCVKDLPDGCAHFKCVHGSCVSTDGFHSCECQTGWVGTFCDQPCPVQCGQHGYCARLDGDGATNASHADDVIKPRMSAKGGAEISGGVVCVCHWNFTGEKCEERRRLIPQIQKVVITGDPISTWQVIVVAMSTTVFLASFLIITTYCLWRRQWLPLRKLVFFFQDYEDDDGKQYDAFISYKGCPRDERFVLNHLYPKLEKELDFRLCLHFRDFPPGHPIANNIIHAIENSRRTIMVLSPAYVMSEWCRMEYQKAQHEMLRLRHRLIPVVLEDIGEVPDVDRNLKTILETITYIKWPGEMENALSKRSSHFWKLLELSMPKKKPDCFRSVVSSGTDSSKSSMTSGSRSYFSHLVDSFSRHSVGTDSINLVNFFKRNQSAFYNTSIASSPGKTHPSLAIKDNLSVPKPIDDSLPVPWVSDRNTGSVQTSDYFYDDVDGVPSDNTSVSVPWKCDPCREFPLHMPFAELSKNKSPHSRQNQLGP